MLRLVHPSASETMKLRLRSADSGETTRVEFLTPSTLLQLRQAIAERLSLSSPSLWLSLNKKDELGEGICPEASFSTLEIASGDLIFYRSLNQPEGSLVSAVNENPRSRDAIVLLGSGAVGCGDASSLDFGDAQLNFLAVGPEGEKPGSTDGTMSSCKLGAMDIDGRRKIGFSPDLGGTHANSSPFMAYSVPKEGEKLVEEGKLEMCEGASQVDEYCSPNSRSSPMNQYANHEFDAGFHRGEGLPNSVLGFLMRVFSGKAGNLKREVDFFIVAIHVVMLESGFLGRLPCVWSAESTVSISYSLGDLLAGNDVQNIATLKIENFPDDVVVYGLLSGPSSKMQRIDLKFSSYGRSIRALVQQMKETDSSYVSHNGKMVLELWKAFKDNVSLPLLHELCDRTGLRRPACLGCLPSELKLDVLGRLGPIDLAKMECVSVEFRNLSSKNDLWRKKYEEVFGSAVDYGRSWKRRCAESWAFKKCSETTASSPNFRALTWYHVPPPLRGPRVVGGDYNWFHFPTPPWNQFGECSCPYGINGRSPGSQMGGRHLGNHFLFNLSR